MVNEERERSKGAGREGRGGKLERATDWLRPALVIRVLQVFVDNFTFLKRPFLDHQCTENLISYFFKIHHIIDYGAKLAFTQTKFAPSTLFIHPDATIALTLIKPSLSGFSCN